MLGNIGIEKDPCKVVAAEHASSCADIEEGEDILLKKVKVATDDIMKGKTKVEKDGPSLFQ